MNKKQSELPNFPLPDRTVVLTAINKSIPNNNFELFVFGSRSLIQTCKDYSDLDLVIRCDKPIPRQILFQIEEDLENSQLNYRVDLLDWHRISDEFKNEITSKLIKI
ncbi:MAG: nucleotidyltransferase domain-containing protein [Gammaproteobacteria bacterium]|nr:nucleotidyltransferase domain-containing protein [Gammaproteobacteria bacterium]